MSRLELRAGDRQLARSVLREALERELAALECAIERTKEVLREFERRFGMRSEEFYERFSRGMLDERDEFIDWAGEFELLRELLKRREVVLELMESLSEE